MRNAPILLATSILWFTGVSTGQDPATGGAPEHRDPQRRYSLSLPEGWRQMTPDEAFRLRKSMPGDIATLLVPGRLDRFGAVDSWLREGFDGRCLTVRVQEGEPVMDDKTLDEVRATAVQKSGSEEFRFVVESLRFIDLGPKQHRAIELVMNIRDAGDRPLYHVLEFVVPSGGSTFRFIYRSGPDGLRAAFERFRESSATIDMTWPAQGRKELSDKLRMPLIIGTVVGLVLFALYKLRG